MGNHGDCTTTYGYANDKFSFNGKGMAVNDDSFRVDITGGAESKPAKSEWKVTGTLDVKAKDLGGAKAVVNADVEYNQKSEIMVKPRVNVEVADEFNVGVSAKWDTKTFKEVWPQLVYKPKGDNGIYWGRLDMMRSLFMTGCDQQLKDGINHSFELVYGWGKDWTLNQEVPHKIDSHWTVSCTQSFDSEQVGGKNSPYHIGFAAAYKL